ncbi:MAG: hypothetical protein VKP62_07385 [Candidatus Sericytochromatia bacterium]|nr:hypothetical protein [Candidatus Sericytochromatia bacterium]
MSHSQRTEAQRRIEADEALLRGIRQEAFRVRARIRMFEGEIAGAQAAIAEKQRVIHEAVSRVQDLSRQLAQLSEQEQKLRDDQDLWGGFAAG